MFRTRSRISLTSWANEYVTFLTLKMIFKFTLQEQQTHICKMCLSLIRSPTCFNGLRAHASNLLWWWSRQPSKHVDERIISDKHILHMCVCCCCYVKWNIWVTVSLLRRNLCTVFGHSRKTDEFAQSWGGRERRFDGASFQVAVCRTASNMHGAMQRSCTKVVLD
jgi:hypothetical protein